MKRGVVIIAGVVFLVIFSIAAFLIGRSPEAPASTTLRIWSPFDEAEIYEEISAEFLAARPGTKLEFRHVAAKDAKEYEAKVVDAIASGEGPDIWLIRNDWLPKHEPKLTPIPETLKWSSKKDVSEAQALVELFTEPVVEQNSRNGKLLAMPLSVDSLALYINQDVIREVRRELSEKDDERADELTGFPKTWSDVESWSRLITLNNNGRLSRSGLALGTINNTYAPIDTFVALLYQLGGKLYSDDESEVSFHHAGADGIVPAKVALERFSSFSVSGNPSYSWNESLGDPVEQLVDGKLAMMVGYSTLQSDILKQNKDVSKIVIAPLPQDQPLLLPNDEPKYFAGYWTHVVSRDSTQPLLAWQLLKSYTARGLQTAYSKATIKPTVNQIQGYKPKLGSTDMGDLSLFAQQVAYSQVTYKPEWQFVDETMQTMIRSVVELGQSAQSAVDTAAEMLKKGSL